MASGTDVDRALVTLIAAAFYPPGTSASGAAPNAGLPVKVVRGWPVDAVLTPELKAGIGTVSVFSRAGLGRSTTRWASTILSRTPAPSTIIISPSRVSLPTMSSAAVTFSKMAASGDAAALLVQNNRSLTAVSAALPVGGSSSAMASAVASAIQASLVASSWLSAASAGPVLNLTSKVSAATLMISGSTGSGGSQLREIGRRSRELQVTVWAPTPAARDAMGPIVEEALSAAEADFGLKLPDGSFGRLLTAGDFDIDQGALSGTYRREFLLAVDYPVTTCDALFSALAISAASYGSYFEQAVMLDVNGDPVADANGNPVFETEF